MLRVRQERGQRVQIGAVFLLATLLWGAPGGAADAPSLWLPVTAVVHVHSNLSTGADSLDTLAARARAAGVDAVFLTDNLLLRYEYGLYPLRGLIRRTVALPSVMDMGIDRYLTQVREAGARHPDVLLIPGVEVAPHYYWTGSPFTKDLTMHDSQKNLLVLGLPSSQDYKRLPVAGNQAAYVYGWMTPVWLAPLLLAVPAIWLLRHPTYKRALSGGTIKTVCIRRTGVVAALLGLAAALLFYNYPFASPRYDAYQDGSGLRPYQDLIEYVQERGGLTFWSMPDARDFNRYDYGRLGVVTVKTDPYPEALLLTTGYTGFGSLHQDHLTAIDPGETWDAALQAYLDGTRAQVPWGVGEVAYHQDGSAGIFLHAVETVLWVRERTVPALLEAMAKGRMYALVRTKAYGLVLNDFSLMASFSGERAISGETVNASPSGDLQIRIAVTASDGQAHPVQVQIIRSGRVLATRTGQTPFVVEYRDSAPSAGRRVYYRLLIGSPGNRIVSNPIFVTTPSVP